MRIFKLAAVIAGLVVSQKGWAYTPSATLNEPGIVAGESGNVGEQESDWLVQYESGEASGNLQIPAHTASKQQLLIAGLILLGTGTVTWMARKDTSCNAKG